MLQLCYILGDMGRYAMKAKLQVKRLRVLCKLYFDLNLSEGSENVLTLRHRPGKFKLAKKCWSCFANCCFWESKVVSWIMMPGGMGFSFLRISGSLQLMITLRIKPALKQCLGKVRGWANSLTCWECCPESRCRSRPSRRRARCRRRGRRGRRRRGGRRWWRSRCGCCTWSSTSSPRASSILSRMRIGARCGGCKEFTVILDPRLLCNLHTYSLISPSGRDLRQQILSLLMAFNSYTKAQLLFQCQQSIFLGQVGHLVVYWIQLNIQFLLSFGLHRESNVYFM